MFGLKRFFEKIGVTRRSSGSISEEAARKAAAFTAEMDKAMIADMYYHSGYALADPANNLSLDELVAIQVAEREVPIKVDIDRVAPATVIFEPDTNRATDTATGMAVACIREDYPLERGEFWTLAWKGKEYEFRVDWDTGNMKLTRERDELSSEEISKPTKCLNLMEYRIPVVASAQAGFFLSNIDLFLDLFAVVARNRLQSRNIEIFFDPWGVERKYHRHLKFTPLKPAE